MCQTHLDGSFHFVPVKPLELNRHKTVCQGVRDPQAEDLGHGNTIVRRCCSTEVKFAQQYFKNLVVDILAE